MQSNREGMTVSEVEICEEIDCILWGKMRRRVLRMVKSMLLSRNETMNGSGYPFGLNKKTIPLEWKLYAIIRAYEALWRKYKTSKQTQLKMDQWSQGGYFDRGIYTLFSNSIGGHGVIPKKTYIPSPVPYKSEQWKTRYTPFVRTWGKILEITKAIENEFDEGRWVLCNEHMQKESFQKISNLTEKLICEIDMRSIIIVGRHGLTQSDIEGVSGAKSESLTSEWELTSHEIWEKFRGLVIDIYSGDLPRAHETAEIIRQEVIADLDDILSSKAKKPGAKTSMICPIYTEKSLTNPDKFLESYWRRKRSRSRLSTIILDERTKPMVEFLEDLDSPSMETIVLLITHGHNANIITELLENYFRRDRISSMKTSMKNGAICTYFLQWGNESKKLLFPVAEWQVTLRALNNMTVKIFWEMFYDGTGLQTDVIILHDAFLDYIDNYIEIYPEKVCELGEQLTLHRLTAHFPEILKRDGVI
jgi:broad specificity phosphatase PhoE